ncbi:MAG: thiol:disulfide interchange protein DsbG [Telluria sp.]
MSIPLPTRLALACSQLVFSAPLLAADLPAAVKALQQEGIEVVAPFKAAGGLAAYAALAGKRPVAIYMTPDGKHAILGTMIGARGEDLSKPVLDKLVGKPLAARTWKELAASAWIADGSARAARVVYVFTDPNCPYCNKFWQDARPWIDAGKVQLRHIMVGIIGPTSPGKAAALLSAKDPALALREHETKKNPATAPAKLPPRAAAQLEGNHTLMQQLELGATPAILYLDSDGLLQIAQGAPQPGKLVQILGAR